MTPAWFIANLCYGAVLFGLGVLGFLIRRNVLVALMCIELMLNGVNVTLVTFSRFFGNVGGQVAASLVMVTAACEAAVGLVLVVAAYRRLRTLDREAWIKLGEGTPVSVPVVREPAADEEGDEA